jgi:hypothetical protein
MNYKELEDSGKLATKEWVAIEFEHRFALFKTDLRGAALDRQSKLLNWAGPFAIGLFWGFVIAMSIFAHR